MTAGSGAPVALIVDDDVGFTFWLGEMFTESGYQSFPALTPLQGLRLAREWNVRVDVLVLNPRLRGATRLAETLTHSRPGLRVVFIRDPAVPQVIPEGQATVERPAPWEPISRTQWAARLRKVLMRFSATT